MTDHSLLPSRTRPARSLSWVPAAAAAALSLALYAVTLHGTYVLDDRAIILDDPRIADPHLWHLYWTDQYFPDAVDNLYRPLVSMSFAIQWRLHGDRAWAFHLVNWLLAAATAAAVAELTRRSVTSVLRAGEASSPVELSEAGDASRRGIRAGLVAGLLFAALPVHVEVVAGIVGRAELLCALGMFLGLCLFVPRPLTAGRAAAIVVCFVVALLSKEQGVLFPVMLAALAFFRVPRKAVSRTERLRGRWLAVTLLWLESAYFFFREHILKFEWNRQWIGWSANPLVRSVGVDRWLMPLVLIGRYVAVIVTPYKLLLDYGGNVIGSKVRYHEPYVYLGVAAVLGWLAVLVICLRLALRSRRRSALAGLAVFALVGVALTFGMVSNFTALIGTIFGERLAFIPSAFLAVLAGLAVAGTSTSTRRQFRVGTLVLVLVAAGSVRTVAYARQWNHRRALYQAELDQEPRSVLLHGLVWREYREAGDWQAARRIGEDCRRQVPQWWQSWLMCFEPEIEMGRLKEAQDLINQAFRVCYNDSLIGWSQLVNRKLAEQAETRPTTRASQPNQ